MQLSNIKILNYDIEDMDLICYPSVYCNAIDVHELSTGNFIVSFDSIEDAEYEIFKYGN
jgi:hypothetical protein